VQNGRLALSNAVGFLGGRAGWGRPAALAASRSREPLERTSTHRPRFGFYPAQDSPLLMTETMDRLIHAASRGRWPSRLRAGVSLHSRPLSPLSIGRLCTPRSSRRRTAAYRRRRPADLLRHIGGGTTRLLDRVSHVRRSNPSYLALRSAAGKRGRRMIYLDLLSHPRGRLSRLTGPDLLLHHFAPGCLTACLSAADTTGRAAQGRLTNR